MENSYILSVIIPVYNTEQYLEQCVQSVQEQTLKSIQIILVDDGSVDYSGVICDQLASKYENIQVIHQNNAGPGVARNTGMDYARGKYIAFLDSDDFLETVYYENLTSLALESESDICYTGGMVKYTGKMIRKELFANVEKGKLIQGDAVRALIPRVICAKPGINDNISASANFCVFNRQFLMKNRLRFVPERAFEDLFFQMDCLNCASRVIYAEETGYIYRYNSDSLSRSYNSDRWNKLKDSIKALEQKCIDLKLFDVEARLAMLFWINFEKCINQVVRFESNQYYSIKKMTEEPIAQHYLEHLSKDRKFKGLHALLCRFLRKKLYITTILCLKVYNTHTHG